MIQIRTPEFLTFRAQVAGPSARAAAWLLDWLLYGMLWGLAAFAIHLSLGQLGLSNGALLLMNFLGAWFYFVGMELLTGGRSPGKIAMKLRVLRIDGLPITWRESVIRTFLRAVDAWTLPPVFFGPVVMVFDPYFRRLGDLAAGTIVVSEDTPLRIRPRSRDARPPRLQLDLHGPCQLSAEEREALELLSSRPGLSLAQRAELAAGLAPLLAARHDLPPPSDPAAFLISLYELAEAEAMEAQA